MAVDVELIEKQGGPKIGQEKGEREKKAYPYILRMKAYALRNPTVPVSKP